MRSAKASVHREAYSQQWKRQATQGRAESKRKKPIVPRCTGGPLSRESTTTGQRSRAQHGPTTIRLDDWFCLRLGIGYSPSRHDRTWWLGMEPGSFVPWWTRSTRPCGASLEKDSWSVFRSPINPSRPRRTMDTAAAWCAIVVNRLHWIFYRNITRETADSSSIMRCRAQ